jgi:hypothetical protein
MREFGYWANLLSPLQVKTSLTLLANQDLLTSLIKPNDHSLPVSTKLHENNLMQFLILNARKGM